MISREEKMKFGLWLVLFLCLPIWSLTAATNRVVLAPENLDVPAIQKLSSSGTETGLEFRMAGIEDEEVQAGGVTARKVSPISSTPEKFGEIAEQGLPDLPLCLQLVAIPDQAGVTAEIISSSYETLENYDIMPTQPPALDGSTEEIPYTRDEEFYQKDEFYPPEIVSVGEPVIMRDLRMVQTVVYPIQYNPVTKQLRVYSNIQYRLTYSGTDNRNVKVRRSNKISEGFLPIYQSLVPNMDEMLANYEPVRGGYVIICKAALADSAKALALWKHQKGYVSRIVPTTEINSNGSPTYTQIYNYLHTAYDTWDVPPEYVMLVGDKEGTFVVPDYPYLTYPSDNQYACVDGGDYLPDIFIARLSVDNMLQFRVAVSKVFKYEKTPLMRDPQHWIRGLSVGYTWYSTARTTTLWVRQKAFQNGFVQVDTVYGQNHDPRVAAVMNAGVGFCWYRGAGDANQWWGPDYSISDLNAMPNNQKLAIMTPLTCGLGDFGAECFGETWIRMGMSPDSLKGGPAFFGVSDHFTHTKWNNPIMIGFYNGAFDLRIDHFAAAAVAGKLQMYRTFPGNPGGYVQQYFNTYNMLGDPELEMRIKIPQGIVVEHPQSIPLGTGYMQAFVRDSLGNPIEGAMVTLIKGFAPSEEVFKLDKTDANGMAEFTFEATTPDSMVITVTGQDLYPYQGKVTVYQPAISVGFDSSYVSGGDNILSPNETVQLVVVLRNLGNNAITGLSAALEPIDTEVVSINDNAHFYGTLQPGAQAISTPFSVHIKPMALNGAVARVKIECSDDFNNVWETGMDLTISAPRMLINAFAFPGGNSRLDPGDTSDFTITLQNQGILAAPGVTASLSTTDPYLTIITPEASYGDIAIGGTVTNSVPFVISCSNEAYNGRTGIVLLHTVSSDGMEEDIPVSFPIGVRATTDPTGPDQYGYYMYDNTDVSNPLHPTFGWIELAPGLGGHGTLLSFGGNTDDNSVLVALPFDLVYYGEHYGRIIVSTNGFIAPDTARYDQGGDYWANFFNWPIPDPGNARAQISPFWDDLQISSSGSYGVFTWNDTTEHRFVIAWNHATNRNTSAIETFEMVIYDPAFYPTMTGDAEMLFQYNAIVNNDAEENYSTVGIENWPETDGIQYTFNNMYGPGAATLAAGRAIRITTNSGRGGIIGTVDLTDSQNDDGARVTASNGRTTLTSTSGGYLIGDLVAGLYDVVAGKDGYFPMSRDSIAVTANQSVQGINFALDPCPIPTALTASEGLSNRIELSWTGVNHDNFVGYNVYRSLWENREFQKLNTNPVVGTSYTDNSVTDSANYWYYVTAAYSGTGWTAESKASNKDEGTLGVPAGAITGRVTAIDGSTPIEGVLLRLLSGSSEIRRDTTNAEGLFTISNLPSALFSIEASKDSFVTQIVNNIQVVSAETVQVNISLQYAPICDYVVGDANGNGSFNGLDVVYSVSYFKGGPIPPYSCECTPGQTWYVAGDVNASCNFNGLDVSYMVSFFKGGPLCNPCPNCPPARLAPPIPGLAPGIAPASSNGIGDTGSN